MMVNVVSPAAKQATAAFQIDSTTKGFLLPRLTAAQALAISSPPDGLMIYVNTTDGVFTTVGVWARVAGAWTKL